MCCVGVYVEVVDMYVFGGQDEVDSFGIGGERVYRFQYEEFNFLLVQFGIKCVVVF